MTITTMAQTLRSGRGWELTDGALDEIELAIADGTLAEMDRWGDLSRSLNRDRQRSATESLPKRPMTRWEQLGIAHGIGQQPEIDDDPDAIGSDVDPVDF